MYDLFDTFFNPWYDDSEYNKKAPKQQAPQNTQNLMKTDIRELADGYELQMELPGYKKEEVQAALHKGYLTISAAKSAEETVEGIRRLSSVLMTTFEQALINSISTVVSVIIAAPRAILLTRS